MNSLAPRRTPAQQTKISMHIIHVLGNKLLFQYMIAETPVDECEFWKMQHTKLFQLTQQLDAPPVKKILEVLDLAGSPKLENHLHHFKRLKKRFKGVRDNFNFLATLMRYFKVFIYFKASQLLPTDRSLLDFGIPNWDLL